MAKLKNKTIFVLILHILCLHSVWTFPTFSSDFSISSTSHLTKSVSSLLQQLDQCFLQIYLDSWTNLKEHITLYQIFNYFHHKTVSYSVHKIVYATDKSWNNVKRNVIQKAKCYAQIFIVGQYWGSNVGSISPLISQESWLYNPGYVIFFAEKEPGNFNINILSWTIEKSHYTGFCYVILNKTEVFQINAALRTTYLVSQVDSLAEETLKYFQNLDMNQNTILSELDSWELGPLSTCDYSINYGIYSRQPPAVEKCIFDELGKRFNFSYHTTNSNGPFFSKVRRRVTMSMSYMNVEIIPYRRQIIELGFVYDQWAYFITKERLKIFDTALIGPFDNLTWISILITLSTLSTVFFVMISYSTIHLDALRKVENFLRIYLYFCGTLLDQSVSDLVTQLPVSGHVTKPLSKILWLSWYFSAFLLAQLYKGEMFSFLTNSQEPDYPTTLENLTRSDLFIYSFTGLVIVGKPMATYDFYLLEVMTASNARYPDYYNKFKDSLKFVYHWLFGMRDFTRNMYVQNHKHLIDKNKTDLKEFGEVIPQNFASFDYIKHVIMHRQLLQLYFPNKWMSPLVPILGYMSTMPWTVDKNSFYPIFKRGLGQIFESGLYNRWDNYHDSANGLENFYEVKNKIRDSGALKESDIKTSVPEKNWRNFYYHYLYSHESKQERKVFEPVSIMLLKIVWILAGILFGISVLLFLLEHLHRQNRKLKEDMVALF